MTDRSREADHWERKKKNKQLKDSISNQSKQILEQKYRWAVRQLPDSPILQRKQQSLLSIGKGY